LAPAYALGYVDLLERFGIRSEAIKRRHPMAFHINWLRLIRFLTQYVAPGLSTVVLVAEVMSWLLGAPTSHSLTHAYNYVLLTVFSLLTAIMIGICGWIVFLWDLDRLFFKLESKIDSQVAALESKSAKGGEDGTLLGCAREMLNNVVRSTRAMAVGSIEKSYWIDINAGGALAFPKPNIAAAVDQIEKSRSDLLAPLTEIVSRAIPLGGISAPIVSRWIFRYFASEIKVRLYRRLVLRFLSQLGALFVLTAICFYISLVAREWVRLQSGFHLADKHNSLSARSDAPRCALRFHGAHASMNLADHGQSERHGVRVLYADVSHVRRHLRDVVAVQGAPLRAAALESAASIARQALAPTTVREQSRARYSPRSNIC
jgi:hypothetical protein